MMNNNDKSLKMVICDVGDAACAILRSPNGYAMMIDCGSGGSTDKENPVDLVYRTRRWLDIKEYSPGHPLTLLHITHPDDDHVRNARRISKELCPLLLHRTRREEFYNPLHEDSDYVKFLDEPYRGHGRYNIDWGFERNKTFRIPLDVIKGNDSLKAKARNNSSIIRYVRYCGIGMLFCGDLEEAGWEYLCNQPNFQEIIQEGSVDILISSHHGHRSGYSKALFKQIGKVQIVIHSKGSEANKEETHVSHAYRQYATGVDYYPWTTKKYQKGYVLTTRNNGNIYIVIKDDSWAIATDKA